MKAIEAENDEGPIKAHQSEVRVNAAGEELRKDYDEQVDVWDLTSGEVKQTSLAQPVKATARDAARQNTMADALPDLARAGYQRSRTGMSRLAGWKQAQQVAPYDRFHVDKNGDQAVVGSIVSVDASTTGISGTSSSVGGNVGLALYGRIPAGQAVDSGAFADTVLLTVQF